MKKIADILFSIKMTIVLLVILAVGAAVATFIENDYGSSTARVLIYYSTWYIATLFLAAVNLSGVMWRYRMWRHPPRFLFHTAFLIIGLGAAITHYYGFEGILHIKEGRSEDRMLSMEPYLQIKIVTPKGVWYQEFSQELSAIGDNYFHYTVFFGDDRKKVDLEYKSYRYAKKGRAEMGLLEMKVCYEKSCKDITLVGKRGAKGFAKNIRFGDISVELEFGSKVVKLPFSIFLKDFELQRYPGSMAPSSYSSFVRVEDGKKSFDYHIYMNHTLDYRGYKFFQSSYDKDESGTILSVNDDPGKIPTYIGYILLTLGLIWNLFDRKSRFGKLTRYLKHSSSLLLFITLFAPLYSATPDDFDKYLTNYAKESSAVAEEFGRLTVQAPMGRMEPVNSLNTQLLYKIHKSASFEGLNPDQVMLGMLSHPELWRYAPLIRIKSPRLKKLLGIEGRYASFANAFTGKSGYKLKDVLEQANLIKSGERGTFEREVIALDEKLNIIYMVFYGNLYRIYPVKGENRWYNPLEAMQKFRGETAEEITRLTHGLIDSVIDSDWALASSYIRQIESYQQKYGADLIPDREKIDAEIFYNRLHLFPRLVGVYILLGLLMILSGFVEILKSKTPRWLSITKRVSAYTVLLLFLLHTFGLGLRWYIAGHAPWSDAYESLLYISWSALLAGLLFLRHSLLVLGATVTVSGIFLFTAHLSNIDPQITNLVPVLKSYWLTIHVSVITASYGFLGLGALLGFITLWLFIFRSEKRIEIDSAIYRLVAIDEAALIIGLSMLTVGNFIGGVWANESWGRYWGWDPKETWAYVSILVYTIVLHLRLIPRFDRPFILAAASYLSFSTIVMTYFGVNFYLSGMHSYATGDPIPIPQWVWWSIAVSVATVLLSWRKRDLKRLRLKYKSNFDI